MVECVGNDVELGPPLCLRNCQPRSVCSCSVLGMAGVANFVPESMPGVLGKLCCLCAPANDLSARCRMLECIALHVAQCWSALHAVVGVVAARPVQWRVGLMFSGDLHPFLVNPS